MSDADYEKYTQYGAPKILYSCTSASYIAPADSYDLYRAKEGECKKLATDEERFACLKNSFQATPKSTEGPLETRIGYSAGIGVGATYNKLLSDAKDACLTGEFKILDKKE